MSQSLNPITLSQPQVGDEFSSQHIFKRNSDGRGCFIDNTGNHSLSAKQWFEFDLEKNIEFSIVPKTEKAIFLALSLVLCCFAELFLLSGGGASVAGTLYATQLVSLLLLCGFCSFFYYLVTFVGYRKWIRINRASRTIDVGKQLFGYKISSNNMR